jgi:hypothetical protein
VIHKAYRKAEMNMEAMIETQLTNGEAGPPKVVATQYW